MKDDQNVPDFGTLKLHICKILQPQLIFRQSCSTSKNVEECISIVLVKLELQRISQDKDEKGVRKYLPNKSLFEFRNFGLRSFTFNRSFFNTTIQLNHELTNSRELESLTNYPVVYVIVQIRV